MLRRTLLDFYSDLSATGGEFVVYDDGYRSRSYTYAEIAAASCAFAGRLRTAGVGPTQTVAIWGENRAEWLVALWGCLLQGVVLVPIDYRASADFLGRVAAIVDARAVLVGDTVNAGALGDARPVWKLSDLRPESGRHVQLDPDALAKPETTADTVAEIIFTSGATADPKGVIITHRNILANIIPIERELAKYRKWAVPFLPIRFLNLLPLSHMFGQTMATFVPPMIPGTVVFARSYAPADIVRQIHDRRVSVLVCVPKILEVLKEHVLRIAPEAAATPEKMHWTARWWRYRRIHRMFGLKFWAVVVGAAPLDPELEAFWGRLGFLVIQGYGLTETAPIVTLNHPLRRAHGAVGTPIPGVEVKIAGDGEILVRGENVTRGYFNEPEATRDAFKDGWFHTGDLGELDVAGQLRIRGRKKEMIVTPEGLNVFPDDVERVLNGLPGVRESAVVGAPMAGSTAERVHAVIVGDPGIDVDAIVRAANRALQDHQKIRAVAIWPEAELPRTEGTRKLKRRELRQWVLSIGVTSDSVQNRAKTDAVSQTVRLKPDATVASVLERFAPGRRLTASTTVDELGLSSLERVELLMSLEDVLQITIDEVAFSSASTVADLEALGRPLDTHTAASVPSVAEPIRFPSWNRTPLVRALRRASLVTWILPLAGRFVTLEVEGLEYLEHSAGPFIFAANHQSHFDTPIILRALPPPWRYRIAPAMAKEFFNAHFHPADFSLGARAANSMNYYLATAFFNAFPLPQRETGTRQTLRYIGTLIDEGYSILIFPEGRRTDRGEINPFRPGVGMMASRLEVAVVPVRVDGLDRVLHHSAKGPTRGNARVAFGAPMSLKGNDYPVLTAEIEDAVRRL